MEQTIIEKDCLLCDSCNKQLSDSDFIITENNIAWREGWLFCNDCDISSMPLVMSLTKGQDVSKTDLAKPIVMEFD